MANPLQKLSTVARIGNLPLTMCQSPQTHQYMLVLRKKENHALEECSLCSWSSWPGWSPRAASLPQFIYPAPSWFLSFRSLEYIHINIMDGAQVFHHRCYLLKQGPDLQLHTSHSLHSVHAWKQKSQASPSLLSQCRTN